MNFKYGVYRYRVRKIDSAFALAKRLYDNGLVQWAEPNFYSNIQATDTHYPEQYYLNNTGQSIDGVSGTLDADIDADKAWNNYLTGSGVRVAVIDPTGVERHEDLEDQNGSSRVEHGFTQLFY